MKPKSKIPAGQVQSLGTKIGEAARAGANSYSAEERQRLLENGMAVIYGASRSSFRSDS